MDQQKKGSSAKNQLIIAALVVVGLAAGYMLGVFSYVKVIGPIAAEMKYKAFLDDYLKPYKEDVIGGDTPEQTIDLFIEALKKGDYELAVKYFEIQEQQRWRESFANPNKRNIDEWISELENNKKTWHKEQQNENTFEFWYNTGAGENEITKSIFVRKNMNNKWKIEGF